MGDLVNAAVKKLSPLKKLTREQSTLVNDILDFTSQHLTADFPAVYTIYGDAGTGKSVVLSQLFDRLQLTSTLLFMGPPTTSWLTIRKF